MNTDSLTAFWPTIAAVTQNVHICDRRTIYWRTVIAAAFHSDFRRGRHFKLSTQLRFDRWRDHG